MVRIQLSPAQSLRTTGSQLAPGDHVRRHLPTIAGPPRNGGHRPACSAAETTKSCPRLMMQVDPIADGACHEAGYHFALGCCILKTA